MFKKKIVIQHTEVHKYNSTQIVSILHIKIVILQNVIWLSNPL